MAEVAATPLNVVFMGTPDFAAVILKALLDSDAALVTAVYTQPDRPSGRGLATKPSPVKILALAHGLPVLQPKNFKDPADIAALAAFQPDVLVVAAYGLILPQAVLDVPKIGPFNVHASLLPKYRGAAPIQRAIENGEHTTGISIMRMEAGLDSGPVVLQRAMGVGLNQDAGSLHDELAELGAAMMVETLVRLPSGRLGLFPQDHDQATFAPKLSKTDGLIDFAKPAKMVHDRIRAMSPWPGATFAWTHGGKPLRLILSPGSVGEPLPPGTAPGTVLGLAPVHGEDGAQGEALAIACADRAYLVPALKPEGKKAMSAREFANGYLREPGTES